MLQRKAEVMLYKTLIRPVLLCVSETWCLKKGEVFLSAFERKVLRKAFGPITDGEMWQIRYKRELYELLKNQILQKC
jgi:hypothetical protein